MLDARAVSRRGFVARSLGICGLAAAPRQAMSAITGPYRYTSERNKAWYSRSILGPDRTIYLHGGRKSTDGGWSFVDRERGDPFLNPLLSYCQHRGRTHDTHYLSSVGEYKDRPLTHRSILLSKRRFVALDYPLYPLEVPQPGKFLTTFWHGDPGLKRITMDTAVFHIPEAGYLESGYWGGFGLYCHRALIELEDGTLLAGLFGNFEKDRIVPPDGADITIKARNFVMQSQDGGRNWHYVATVAAPKPNMVDNQEGYTEWDMAELADGRLLGVMRTGHWTPLLASYSSDQGRSWTAPARLPGLNWGVDPCLIRLKDGRLALAYGRNRPAPREEDRHPHMPLKPEEAAAFAQQGRFGGRSCELAISEDGTGAEWTNMRIAPANRRSAYPTIFEIDPNVIFYQTGDECSRIELSPRR